VLNLRGFMKEEFLSKLNEWYKGYTLQRYEIIQETDSDVILLSAIRGNDKHLCFEIVRIFSVGNSVELSVDKSIDTCGETCLFDSIVDMLKTILRVA